MGDETSRGNSMKAMGRTRSPGGVTLEGDIRDEHRDVTAPGSDDGSFLKKRRQRSLLALAAEAKAQRTAGGGSGQKPPPPRGWVRGAFRFEPSRPVGTGLLSSLLFHGAFGTAVLAGAFNGFGGAALLEKSVALSAVVVELPKIETPKPKPLAVPAAARKDPVPASPQGVKPGPVPKGVKSRKGTARLDDARQAGVLGMLGSLEGRGNRASKERGATVGPDQGSAAPFTGLVGLKDYEGGYLPVGGAGGGSAGGVGADEGIGAGGGRGSGQAKGLLNSYGDGTGDQIVLERRGSAAGVVGGAGTGDGFGGCRDEAAIARVVESHKGAVRRCYNTALKRDRDLLGEISVRFVIAESGAVRAASVIGRSLSDSTLESCVLERVRAFRFDEKPGCETIVRYTFNLTRSL